MSGRSTESDMHIGDREAELPTVSARWPRRQKFAAASSFDAIDPTGASFGRVTRARSIGMMSPVFDIAFSHSSR